MKVNAGKYLYTFDCRGSTEKCAGSSYNKSETVAVCQFDKTDGGALRWVKKIIAQT